MLPTDTSACLHEVKAMTAKAKEHGVEPAYQVLSFQPLQEAQARKYVKRKSHRKSKGGCFGCKLSRVKCDEAKPTCTRCIRSKVDCRYSSQTKTKPACTPTTSPADLGSDATLAMCYSPIPFAQPSFTSLANACLESKTAARGISRVSLLHHIQQHFGSFQGLETAGGQIASVLNLGMNRPYLLDVTLAVAASHLRHMYQATGSSQSLSTDTITACRVAEHYQQSLAIRGFNRALAEPLDQDGSDSIIISSMMLNLLAFALDENEDPSQSWVFSTAPNRLAWFSLNLGLAPILMNTKEFHANSILRYIFDASDDEEKTYHGDDPKPLSSVPAHWLRLCGLDCNSEDLDHVLYEPVRILAELCPVPITNDSFFLYMAFFGKLGIEFRTLLQSDDERAMWLLGSWLGMLCRFDAIWWLSSRARRDYRAICIWLDKRRVRMRTGEEGAMWRQLMVDLEGATQPPFLRTEPMIPAHS